MAAPSSPPSPGSAVAVVGGTGFLGAQIVAELAHSGYRPVAVARHPELVRTLLPDLAVGTRAADIMDLPALVNAFEGCAAVHSTVALVDQAFIGSTPEAEQQLVHTNVEGALNVLRAARAVGIGRVVLTGSCSMRYAEGGVTTRESSPPTPPGLVNDAYVKSKLMLEREGRRLADELGLTLTFTMPGALYGPGDRLPSIFGQTIVDRLKGETQPTLIGGMPLSDIRDVARAHVRIMQLDEPAPAYLLVAQTIDTRAWHDLISKLSGAPRIEHYISPKLAHTMAILAETAGKVSGKPPRFNRNTIQHVILNQQYDCSLAREQLGMVFAPTEATLRDAIAWFLDHGYADKESVAP